MGVSYGHEAYTTTHSYKPSGSYMSKRPTYRQGGNSAKPYDYSPSTFEQGGYEESNGNDGYSTTSDYKPVSYEHDDYTTTRGYKPSGSYRSKRSTYRQGGYSAKPYGYSPSTYEQGGYEESYGTDGYSTTSDYKPVSYGRDDHTMTHGYKPSGSYRSKRSPYGYSPKPYGYSPSTYDQGGYEESYGNDGYSTNDYKPVSYGQDDKTSDYKREGYLESYMDEDYTTDDYE